MIELWEEIEDVLELESFKEEQERMINFSRRFNRIFLYGSGRAGRKIHDFLNDRNIAIAGFLVTKKEYISEMGSHKEVLSLDDYEYRDGDGIIISVAEKTQKLLYKNLIDKIGDAVEKNVICQKLYFLEFDTIDASYNYAGVTNSGNYFRNFEKLNQIGLFKGTDKSSKWHNYLDKYEFFIKKWINSEITVLELGVFKGDSTAMWADYFQRGNIIGVDINPGCKEYETHNIHIKILDLSKRDAYDELLKEKPTIIIDDASHNWKDQIMSFVFLFESIEKGGIYIMEDIGTSFGVFKNSSFADSRISGYEFCSLMAEAVSGDIEDKGIPDVLKEVILSLSKQIDMVCMIYGSCIFIKK